jgi:hypothetical protein
MAVGNLGCHVLRKKGEQTGVGPGNVANVLIKDTAVIGSGIVHAGIGWCCQRLNHEKFQIDVGHPFHIDYFYEGMTGTCLEKLANMVNIDVDSVRDVICKNGDKNLKNNLLSVVADLKGDFV